MCTRKYYGEGSMGLLKLWIFIAKLQRSFAAGEAKRSDFDDEEIQVSDSVPDDVKEGHFAVLAVTGSEKTRFVVKIDECLSSPAFLRLLEQAKEEYGFRQTGAISVPCRPDEFQKILKGMSTQLSV